MSPADVLKLRKIIKRGSALGPDGIMKVGLVRWDPKGNKLARLFNGFLVNKNILEVLKHNRTTLLEAYHN